MSTCWYSIPVLFGLLSVVVAQTDSVSGYAIKMATAVKENEAKVSSECGSAFLEYSVGLGKGEGWALKMFDATSKLQSGIISGNLYELGHYDQCVSIENEGFHQSVNGKYCLGSAGMLNGSDLLSTLLRVASNISKAESGDESASDDDYKVIYSVCVPHACYPTDIQVIFSDILKRKITFSNSSCLASEKSTLTPQSTACIAMIIVVCLLVALATTYDLLWYNEKVTEPLPELWICFSAYNNIRKLVTSSKKPYHLIYLNGIKAISMFWIHIAHSYLTSMYGPTDNEMDVMRWTRSPFAICMVGASMAVDTFLVIGGLLTVYTYLRKKDCGLQFNVFLYYIHRFVRLTPALIIVVMLHTFLLQQMGSGPMWSNINAYLGDVCRRNWWSTLLYVQNYINPAEICVPQSWYLSIDVQCFIFSPLLLLPLSRWPKISISIIIGLLAVAIIGTLIIGWELKLTALFGSNGRHLGLINVLQNNGTLLSVFNGFRPNSPEFLTYYYYPAHTRMASYLIGMLVGYAIYILKFRRKNVTLPKGLVIVCWILTSITMTLCTFGGLNISRTKYNAAENAFYIAFARPAWAFAVSWVLFACSSGHAGILPKFLALPIFQFMCKISYSVFLLHYSIMLMNVSATKTAIHFSNYEQIHKALGDLCLIIFASTIFTLLFESPLIAVEKVYVGEVIMEKRLKTNASDTAPV